MHHILYIVNDPVGLPSGFLGEGMPDVLYAGTLIRGERLVGLDMARLIDLNAISPAQDQSQAENILATPTIGKGEAKTATPPAVPAAGGVQAMTVAQLKAKATEMGLDIPRGANKAEIQELIDAAVREAESGKPGPDDLEVNGTANGGA